MTIRPLVVALAAAAAMLAVPAAAQAPTKPSDAKRAGATMILKFGAGTTEKTMAGSVKDGFTIDYRIAVRAGQKLAVRLTSAQKVAFTVLSPDGKALPGASGVRDFAVAAGTAGDYSIRVAQTPPTGKGDYSLTIGLR